MYIDNSKTGFNYFINCDDEEVEVALKNELDTDSILFGAGKNLLNGVLPLRLNWKF